MSLNSDLSLSEDLYEEEEIESDIYEVEKIIRHKDRSGIRYYEIKWKGYPESENTWEKESNLNCHTLLKEYLDKISKRQEYIKKEAKSIEKPIKILSIYKQDKELVYKVLYENDSIGELHSSRLKKLNPMIAIEFLEKIANFKVEE